jgi:hypothetical protein
LRAIYEASVTLLYGFSQSYFRVLKEMTLLGDFLMTYGERASTWEAGLRWQLLLQVATADSSGRITDETYTLMSDAGKLFS